MAKDSAKIRHSPTFTDVLLPAAFVDTKPYLEYPLVAFTANLRTSVTLDGVTSLQFASSVHVVPSLEPYTFAEPGNDATLEAGVIDTCLTVALYGKSMRIHSPYSVADDNLLPTLVSYALSVPVYDVPEVQCVEDLLNALCASDADVDTA